MIYIADMRDFGAKVDEHGPHSLSSLKGIDCAHGAVSFGWQARAFKIRHSNKVPAEFRTEFACVFRRKQTDFMPLRAHQLHRFKQVRFGPAEPVVVLVAVQDPHKS
jgi:hypothetical protein